MTITRFALERSAALKAWTGLNVIRRTFAVAIVSGAVPGVRPRCV